MNERRCHFSIVISRTLRQAWAILALMLFNVIRSLLESKTGVPFFGILAISGALLLILAIIFLFNFLRWRKTYVFFEGGELIIDRRTINSSRANVRLSSIAAVNLTQGILERIFGTYRLQLDINSSATAGTTDFELVFRREEALQMKDLLTEEPSAVIDEPEGDRPKENTEAICAFPFSQVVRHCVLSIPVWSILIVAFVGLGAWFQLKEVRDEGSSLNIGSLFVMAIIVVPIIWQAISPFFRYYHFTMKKQADGSALLISYGLITMRNFTLPLDKTNAIVLKQPFFARAFGLCYGELVNVGMVNAKENVSPVFCLLLPREQVLEIVRQITPEYVPCGEPKRSPGVAILPVLMTWEAWGLVLLSISWAVGFWQIGVVLMALFIPCAILSCRTKELQFYEKKVSISSGVFEKRTITIDSSKLQNLTVSSGPVCRPFGLAKGSVTILAAGDSRANAIGYFPKKDFERLESALLFPHWQGYAGVVK